MHAWIFRKSANELLYVFSSLYVYYNFLTYFFLQTAFSVNHLYLPYVKFLRNIVVSLF